jgi:predicted HTH transcriptional regulator
MGKLATEWSEWEDRRRRDKKKVTKRVCKRASKVVDRDSVRRNIGRHVSSGILAKVKASENPLTYIPLTYQFSLENVE